VGILAIALFGSRARGDHGPASDTDLLLLTDEPGPQKIVEGKLSLSFYPVDFLLERARYGDLFVAHIVLEAKPLHDPDDLLGDLRTAYVPAADLDEVIRRATDLGRFVIANWPALDAVGLVDRRIAWTVRTILIARIMRARGPNFATSGLVSFSGDASVEDLIGAKEEPFADIRRLQLFEVFLDRWGDPRSPRGGDMEAFRELFDDTGNSFGLSTVRRLSGERAATEHY
jgi:hypothetical protein